MTDITGPITQDHVAEAVAALTAAGKRPSWRAVRAHLGKGSPNTILEHLRALDRGRQDQAASTELPPPAAITDLVGSKVWQAALAAAREQVTKDRSELEARLAAEQARADELAAAVERLEELLAAAQRQADAQVAALAQLQIAADRAEHHALQQESRSEDQTQRLLNTLTAIAAAQADHRTATAAQAADARQALTALSAGVSDLAPQLASLEMAAQAQATAMAEKAQAAIAGLDAVRTEVAAQAERSAAQTARALAPLPGRMARLEAWLRVQTNGSRAQVLASDRQIPR